MKYRKKPVVIDAEVFQWGMEDGAKLIGEVAPQKDKFEYLEPYIATSEGNMVVSKGDYIITGVKGERYPCKPDIFHLTYEAVEGNMSQSNELLEWREGKLQEDDRSAYDEEKETKKIMEETGMSFYDARELARDAAPYNQKHKHRKPAGMDWGTFWKTV